MLIAAIAAGAAIAAALLAVGCGSNGKSDEPPPHDFIGVVAQDAFVGGRDYQARTLARIRQAGAGLVRQTFDWAQIEQRPGRYRFTAYDRFEVAAGRAGVDVLPVLFDPPPFRSGAPARGARRGTYPPRRAADMARFAAALVDRYGPRGTLWRARPKVTRRPIRSWQVWNEPNAQANWPTGPDARAYARLLRVIGSAIKRRDPGATVVTGGIPETRRGVPLLRYVDALYRAGAASSFDALAIHAYARDADGVLGAVEQTRRLMRSRGDGAKPIWVTELGWASDGPPSEFTVGRRGQASRIGRTLAGLVAARPRLGVRGIIYFGWRDARPYAGGRDFFGLHTGLLDIRGRPKPALESFRRASRPG